MMNKFNCCFIASFVLVVQLTYPNNTNAQNGTVKTYFPNGEVQSELSYVNDILEGNSVWFYQNGNVKSEKNYDNGILNGLVKEYYDSGLLKEEDELKDGVKIGIDRSYFDNGGLQHIYYYSKGIITRLKNFDFDSNYSALPKEYLAGKRNQDAGSVPNFLPCDVEVCPSPIGGTKAIQDNLVYPEHALKYGLEGTVTLKATINPEGVVAKTEIIKSLDLGCDEAAQDAVMKTKFHPGLNGGKPVISTLMINVDFRIFRDK